MYKRLMKFAAICSLIFLTVPSINSQAKFNHTNKQLALQDHQQSSNTDPIPFPEIEINRDLLTEGARFVPDVAEFSSISGEIAEFPQNSASLQKKYTSAFIDQSHIVTSAPSGNQQSTLATGIYGHVTQNGVNVSGILLQLRYYNGSSWSTYTTTNTDSNGDYSFSSAPSLANGEYYKVWYVNSTYVADRIWYWGTKIISTYSAGDNVHIGDFDIADVGDMSPEDEDTVSLEKDFEWDKRPNTPTDLYELNLFNPSGDEYWFSTVGDNNSHKVNCLPQGFNTGTDYGWYVGIYSPDGGYGYSFYLQIKFKNDHSCSKIHGTVTQNGSAASGVYLQLRYTDDNGASYSTRSDYTTGSDGAFEFVNIPTIPAGEKYYVRYIGDNNSSISDALWFWGTSQVSGYTQNTNLDIEPFDIADVNLGLPAHNATISLPYTFTWDLRPASSGDNYYLAIEDDAEFTPSWMNSKGYNNSAMLSCLYYAMETGTPYRWWIDINHPGTNAYGISYYYHVFTISSGSACGTIFSFLPISIR